MKIAIIGATGHIAKCAFWIFSQEYSNEFFLFSRSLVKLQQFYDEFRDSKLSYFQGYSDFQNYEYDIIFNGIGVWDTPNKLLSDIFFVTEYYDNLIIEYQKTHPLSVSIHISSGAAYANNFKEPVDLNTNTAININKYLVGDHYSIAKINSEIKHRSLYNLNIVDIRLFGFFSRFMDIGYPYLLSALINSVKENRTFRTISLDFWRDYIHMDDFSELLYGIARSKRINVAIDIRSKKPVSKNELIQFFVNKYNLRIEVDDGNIEISQTGVKPYYYSHIENAIYAPRFTSLESVENELEYFIGE